MANKRPSENPVGQIALWSRDISRPGVNRLMVAAGALRCPVGSLFGLVVGASDDFSNLDVQWPALDGRVVCEHINNLTLLPRDEAEELGDTQ